MIILMNGPARAGKTTLSKALANYNGNNWRRVDSTLPFKKYINDAAIGSLRMTEKQIGEHKDRRLPSGSSFRDAYIKAADALECLDKAILMKIALKNYDFANRGVSGGQAPFHFVIDSCSKLEQLKYAIDAFPLSKVILVTVFSNKMDVSQGTFSDGRHNLMFACTDTDAYATGRFQSFSFINPGAVNRHENEHEKQASIRMAYEELDDKIRGLYGRKEINESQYHFL